MRRLRIALMLAIVLPAMGADRPANDAPLPVPGYLDPALDRQVTIVKRGADTIEEYRAGGKLYLLKVAPANGTPYLLIDEKGDGAMTRTTQP